MIFADHLASYFQELLTPLNAKNDWNDWSNENHSVELNYKFPCATFLGMYQVKVGKCLRWIIVNQQGKVLILIIMIE